MEETKTYTEEEYNKLREKYFLLKSRSDSHRKARDYHKELVAKMRIELSNYRRMSGTNSEAINRITAELELLDHKAKFWKTLAIFLSVITAAFAALFYLEINS
jgi:hypothetical protein